MSKAILMSIKPRFAQLILGKTKTIEIRKRFPKDFKGRVYIYHTKAKNPNEWLIPTSAKRTKENDCSGKVVARFWCDNVDEFGSKYAYAHKDNHFYDILKCACLTPRELTEYAHFTYEEHIKEKSKLYAIPILKLEIFDEPKELSEFKTLKSIAQYKKDIEESRKEDLEIHERIIRDIENCGETTWAANNEELTEYCYNLGCYGLQRAPQSWQYVEVEK